MRVEVGHRYRWIGSDTNWQDWEITEISDSTVYNGYQFAVARLIENHFSGSACTVGQLYDVPLSSPRWTVLDDFKAWAATVRKEHGL